MQLYSTKHQSPDVELEEAVFRGLPSDNGLYMPYKLPVMDASFFESIDKLSFQEIAFQVAKNCIGSSIPEDVLKQLVYDAVNFDAPVRAIETNVNVLELFHGPSMAFKDFGARFMSRIISYYLSKSSREINILVATSGDTGGAVALGFLNIPGIKVTILYPSGAVSDIQEKQLTGLGGNITALEVQGTFDDCQKMVKEAFLDSELTSKMNLSSANSINIARLIPQMFYYFYSYAQVKHLGKPVVYSVPSGNFGNLVAGLFAKKMGLPIHQFIASTNANNIVPNYLNTGKFTPRPSIKTLSNAMDVGNPSNFYRMVDYFGNSMDLSDVSIIRSLITGYSFDDDVTARTIETVFESTGYMMCPHTTVAYLGLKKYMDEKTEDITGILLATAHPAKFLNELAPETAAKVIIPDEFKALMKLPKKAILVKNEYSELKNFLLNS